MLHTFASSAVFSFSFPQTNETLLLSLSFLKKKKTVNFSLKSDKLRTYRWLFSILSLLPLTLSPLSLSL